MPPRSPPEIELVAAARRGSADAFRALVERYQAAVRAFLGARLRDLDAADDLAQEVFLAAFRSLAGFREEAEFRTWLFGIAKRLAASHVRQQARRRRLEGAHLEASILEWRQARSARCPLTLSLEEERVSSVRECMDGLPPHGKELLLAHYFDRRSLTAIAASNGKSAGSVRMHLSRIRAALAECVRRKLEIRETDDET